jgi:Ca2+-binding RTX toxin-like protein
MAIKTGTANNDTLTGTTDSDTLSGLEGNDTLYGGSGNDLLDGGAGTDTLVGGTGDDTYGVDNVGDSVVENAGAGIDTVQSAVSHTLAANVENLTLTGTAALSGTGNALNNKLLGNDGNNILDGGLGNDKLDGLFGDDALFGGGGNDMLVGGIGNDRLIGGTGNDYLRGDNGNDMLVGGLGGDMLIGGVGDDIFKFNSPAEISNGYDFDWITDLAVGDRIDLSAIAGLTFAGVGNDFTGVANQVRVSVDAYNGGGSAIYTTYLDIDTDGNKFADYSLALNGWLNIEETAAGSKIYRVAPNLTLTGTASNDTLTSGNGNDTLNGGAGNDLLNSGAGNDMLYGGDGDDTLIGGLSGYSSSDLEINIAGYDRLYGGAGNDTLIGGLGPDILTGGAGNDTFKFNSLAECRPGVVDSIVDFALGDKIDLAGVDANINLAGDQSFTFVGANAFTGVAGQLQYQSTATGILRGDIDGDGHHDLIIALTGSPTLTATDFVL